MAGDISEETPRKIILNAVQVMMNTKTPNIKLVDKPPYAITSLRVRSSKGTKSRRPSTTSLPSSQGFSLSSSEGGFRVILSKIYTILWSRYANIFFLAIGLLQQIPGVSPTGRYVTIVPLFLILTIIAIKEIIEDIKRHNGDRKVNNTKVAVLSGEGKWVKKPWREVKVGNILRVEDGHYFPADLILLSSSEPQGMCYIETANLDGETNLKIRSSLMATSQIIEGTELSQMYGTVEAEAPNRRLYEFAGNISLMGRGRWAYNLSMISSLFLHVTSLQGC